MTLKEKFNNRLARFNRETMYVVIEMQDGSEAFIEGEKGHGDVLFFAYENMEVDGFNKVCEIVESLIDAKKVFDVRMVNY